MVKDEEIPQENKKLFQVLRDIQSMYDPIKVFNLNAFYDDQGLVVDPEYTGLGIAKNFLKVR